MRLDGLGSWPHFGRCLMDLILFVTFYHQSFMDYTICSLKKSVLIWPSYKISCFPLACCNGGYVWQPGISIFKFRLGISKSLLNIFLSSTMKLEFQVNCFVDVLAFSQGLSDTHANCNPHLFLCAKLYFFSNGLFLLEKNIKNAKEIDVSSGNSEDLSHHFQ